MIEAWHAISGAIKRRSRTDKTPLDPPVDPDLVDATVEDQV